MKKYCSYIFLALFGLIGLGSCSHDSVLALPNEPVEEVDPLDSEQEICFGSTGVAVTRGDVFTSADDDVPNLGVFALAWQVNDANHRDDVIDWWQTDDVNLSCCKLDNVAAKKKNQSILWDTSVPGVRAHYYYPISQLYSYDFYAYYPRVADLSKSEAGEFPAWVSAPINIDGTTDVLWAVAHDDTPNAYAYSARYMRNQRNSDGSLKSTAKLPELTLQHQLARLVFWVKPGMNVGRDRLEVTGITVVNAYDHLSLMVARQNDYNTTGRLTVRDGHRTNLQLRGFDVNSGMVPGTNDVNLSNPWKQIGSDLLVFPVSQYALAVTVYDHSNGEEHTSEIPLTLSLGENRKFEAGTQYNVHLTINTPEEILLNATIVDWALSDDEPEIEL